jgi:hypothetical protein
VYIAYKHCFASMTEVGTIVAGVADRFPAIASLIWSMFKKISFYEMDKGCKAKIK